MTVEKRAATAEIVLEALAVIATELNLDVAELDYSIDSEQFINENGQKIGRRDVEVTAWKKVIKPGVQEMQAWLVTTIEVLGLEAEVSVREAGETLHFTIKSEEGGRIIGHRGSTLKSIEKLMKEFSSKEGYEWVYALHVDGGDRREKRRERDDSRGRDRDRKRGDRRDKRDDEGLKKLATKLANRVLENGEPVIIEKELNGYQRRIVHMTIKELTGVNSESFDDEGVRKLRLVLATGEEEQSSSSED